MPKTARSLSLRLFLPVPTLTALPLGPPSLLPARWIHVGPFQPQGAAKGCTDADEKCEEWAVLGECECALRCLAVWLKASAVRTASACCVGVGVHGVPSLLARLTQVAGSDTPASLAPSLSIAGEKNPVSASRVRWILLRLSAFEGWANVALSAIIDGQPGVLHARCPNH